MRDQDWTPYQFQEDCCEAVSDGKHGILNAPTGSGKTYALVTPPESAHVLMTYKSGPDLFINIDVVVVDKWHELVGNKRGVQTELVVACIRSSATAAVVL